MDPILHDRPSSAEVAQSEAGFYVCPPCGGKGYTLPGHCVGLTTNEAGEGWERDCALCGGEGRILASSEEIEEIALANGVKVQVVEGAGEPMRTYWMSFCDGTRPKGTQFLGALVVDVTQAEAHNMILELVTRFPRADLDEGPWIAAASHKAHQAKVNPGGEVASIRMDDLPNWGAISAVYPRLRLMSKQEIAKIDDLIETAEVAQ